MSSNHDALLKYQRVADQSRRDELILSHLPLVKHVIGRLVGELPPGVDVENLESAGVLGLVEAAGKFDPTRNAQFKTFAYLRIRGAVYDELRRNSPLPQHMLERVALVRKALRSLPAPVTIEVLAAATGMSADDVADTLAADRFVKMVSWEQNAQPNGLAPAESMAPPEAELERWEAVQHLTEAIELLPEKERLAVTLYYREELRLREIGQIMKLSTSRISRLITRAIFELGETLRHRNTKMQGEMSVA
jgi:RNA polymerase sigma factor FliA